MVTVARATTLLPGSLRNLLPFRRRRLSPRQAYRLWSETYESQEADCHDVDLLRSLFRALRLEIMDFEEKAYEGTLLVLGFRLRKQGR